MIGSAGGGGNDAILLSSFTPNLAVSCGSGRALSIGFSAISFDQSTVKERLVFEIQKRVISSLAWLGLALGMQNVRMGV